MRSPEVYRLIKTAHMSLVFVNTRALAEFAFAELWRINEDKLPIALHHGSLDVGQRRRVEAAMSEGRLKAVVCTSTLDLGIDWGDVDLVINPRRAERREPADAADRPAPITGSTSRRVPSSFRRTVLKCSNAALPSMQPMPASRTRRSRAAVRSMSSVSTFLVWLALSRFSPTIFSMKSFRPSPIAR